MAPTPDSSEGQDKRLADIMDGIGDLDRLTPLLEKYGAKIHTHGVEAERDLRFVTHPFFHDFLWTTSPKILRRRIVTGQWSERRVNRNYTLDNAVDFIFLRTPRPYQHRALCRLLYGPQRFNIPDADICKLIIQTWITVEIFDRAGVDLWLDLLADHAGETVHTLDVAPLKRKHIRLYHGVEFDDYGDIDKYAAHSWTLDRDVAVRFANRFAKDDVQRPVLHVTLTPEQVQARAAFYTDARGEQEVLFLIDPRRPWRLCETEKDY